MSHTFDVDHADGTSSEVVADYVRHGFPSADYGPLGDHLVLVLGDHVVGVFPPTVRLTRRPHETTADPRPELTFPNEGKVWRKCEATSSVDLGNGQGYTSTCVASAGHVGDHQFARLA